MDDALLNGLMPYELDMISGGSQNYENIRLNLTKLI